MINFQPRRICDWARNGLIGAGNTVSTKPPMRKMRRLTFVGLSRATRYFRQHSGSASTDQRRHTPSKRDHDFLPPNAFTESTGGINQRVWMRFNEGRVFRDLVIPPRIGYPNAGTVYPAALIVGEME